MAAEGVAAVGEHLPDLIAQTRISLLMRAKECSIRGRMMFGQVPAFPTVEPQPKMVGVLCFQAGSSSTPLPTGSRTNTPSSHAETGTFCAASCVNTTS